MHLPQFAYFFLIDYITVRINIIILFPIWYITNQLNNTIDLWYTSSQIYSILKILFDNKKMKIPHFYYQI